MTQFVDELRNRKLLALAGDDALTFLQNIVTCDLEFLKTGEAKFGALLSPQGKILFDFFVVRIESGYLLDTHADLLDELHKRLMFYRLRAAVEINPCDNPATVFACWGDQPSNSVVSLVKDPRHPDAGWRVYSDEQLVGESSSYTRHRIDLCIPEGGVDFSYSDAFPHETLMDQFGGVDFAKGCYVGQEVVSRMQHRGTARKRVVKVHSERLLPQTGTDITVGGIVAGTLGSTSDYSGLALLRLDRIKAGLDNGTEILAGEVPIGVSLPDWVGFSWPEGK